MTRYQNELDRLNNEIATLRGQINRQDGDIARMQAKIREYERHIELLTASRDFYKEQNDLNLGENRQLRDRLYKNPYSDDFYNEM